MALPDYRPPIGAQPIIGRRCVQYSCDSDGGARVVTSGAPTDQEAEIIAADDADRMLPSGYYALPPDGTEGLVVETDAGPAIIAERSDCPITLQSGEIAICQWDGKAWVKLDPNAVTVRVASGGSGVMEVSAGGTTDAVALAGKVYAELTAIAAAISALGGSYTPSSVEAKRLKAE